MVYFDIKLKLDIIMYVTGVDSRWIKVILHLVKQNVCNLSSSIVNKVS